MLKGAWSIRESSKIIMKRGIGRMVVIIDLICNAQES